jgi:hypothetical protein
MLLFAWLLNAAKPLLIGDNGHVLDFLARNEGTLCIPLQTCDEIARIARSTVDFSG